MEPLAHDCFNNHFSSDYGTPAKNTPLIDGLNDKEPADTSCCIDYSTSLSCSTKDSTISDLTIPSVFSSDSYLSTSTIRSRNTVNKAATRKGGKINRNIRCYCSGRIPNGKRYLKITLWFCNVCSKFNKKVCYCKLLGRDCFENHKVSFLENR